MTLRTTIRLPADLLARAKRKAAADGTTVTALIEQGLRLVVARKKEQSARILPRVSKASGPPGTLELPSFSALEDEDDLERLHSGGLR